MTEFDRDAKIFFKFIYELTIVRRDAVSQKLNIDDKVLRLIHTASSYGKSGKSWPDFLEFLKNFSEGDPGASKFIQFAVSRVSLGTK
jgi:hypothetical protein